jgi:hypothetical protein
MDLSSWVATLPRNWNFSTVGTICRFIAHSTARPSLSCGEDLAGDQLRPTGVERERGQRPPAGSREEEK